MDIKPEHQQRLSAALQYANEAFWAKVAENFPEARTGDFSPELTYARDYHNSEDVLWWLTFNAPQLMVGYVEEQKPVETLKPGVYESYYGNAISWDGQTAFDLDMGEVAPFSVILKDRYIRPLD